MPCTSQLVPQYLHWNNRLTFADGDFVEPQNVYRIGNPIEFPNGTITALSCKWSLFINEADVLFADDPPKGDDFRYARIIDLRQYSLRKNKIDGNNLGWHKLTCKFIHTPNECDYSHCEILIQHQIFDNDNDNNLISSFIYTYQVWQNKEALLQNDNRFYKDLRKEYRVQIIKLFEYPKA